MTPDLELLCREVCNLTRSVGDFIQGERNQLPDSGIESKSLNNFVTIVDKQSEEALVKHLHSLYPEAGFIAEEGTADEQREWNWVIDPIDGTTNYIHGLPCFSISIALMRQQQVKLGVVYEINAQECFYAWEGHIAMMNDEPISVTRATKVQDTLIATGFPYDDYGKLDEYLQLFKHLMQNSRGLRRLGSAAVDLAYVACGRFDSFYEYGLNSWDVAAGAFIVQQAGGQMSDFKGGNEYIFGRELLASNKHCHNEMLGIIQKYFS